MERHQFCSGSVPKAEETEQSLLIWQGVIFVTQNLSRETRDPVNYKDDLSNVAESNSGSSHCQSCDHLESVVCLHLCDWSGVDLANVSV